MAGKKKEEQKHTRLRDLGEARRQSVASWRERAGVVDRSREDVPAGIVARERTQAAKDADRASRLNRFYAEKRLASLADARGWDDPEVRTLASSLDVSPPVKTMPLALARPRRTASRIGAGTGKRATAATRSGGDLSFDKYADAV
ncbi:MAG: hypothetical protein DRP08_05225, partial [Candidatus Aenigmatarchaeota archaeon]